MYIYVYIYIFVYIYMHICCKSPVVEPTAVVMAVPKPKWSKSLSRANALR